MLSSSFRDPDGYVFKKDGVVYRNVSKSKDIKGLIGSGLDKELTEAGLMIPFEYTSADIIRPQQVPFISYPYEWCFSMLKEAALVTLEICKRAIDKGMMLKDASTYNIQYVDGKMKLIDHLSLEVYWEGKPWIAYKQFCEHFLAPLALMSYKDIRLGQLFRIYIDGIPLDLTNSLLPLRTSLNPHLLLHIKAHSASQKYYENNPLNNRRVSRTSLLGIIDSLESCIKRLSWNPKSMWTDYYLGNSNYSKHKEELVETFLDKTNPKIVWDLGANIGLFSNIASKKGTLVISLDSDPACVEFGYLNRRGFNILPLLIDLTNPSPGIGWENKERMSLKERSNADTILVLALIHHLAISNNLPLGMIAEFLKDICHFLIIEFIPKKDPKVQKLLSTRKDIFPNYTQEAFEKEFSKYFFIKENERVRDSNRILYLMEKK